MKILLLNPPFLPNFSREQRSPAVTKSGTFYYPMWLCYAAGVLEKGGFEVKVVDAPARGLEHDEILAIVSEFSPSLVVVDTSTPSIHNDVAVAVAIKKRVGAFVLLVGTHPSALPGETLALNDAVDAVARKEYEHTVLELAKRIRDGLTDKAFLASITGLSFRMGGDIIHNPERELAVDIDSMPFVSDVFKRHLNYHDYFYAHSRYPIVTLITGRGCPYQCVYCLYPQTFNGHAVRLRSIKNVVDEIEFCLQSFPDLQEIMFEDDTLTMNKARMMNLANEILGRGLKFKWSANSRANVDLETMQLMKKAGARLFCVGIESGDQAVLDSIRKNIRLEQIKNFFADAKKAGILIHGCFLVGNPGETKETLSKTLQFALELNPDTAQFFPIMVYPGTEAYRWAKTNGYLTTEDFSEWLTPTGLHNCVVSRPGLTNHDLVAFCDEARRRFYMRPGYIVRKLAFGIRDFQEFKRLAKGAATLSKYILQGTFGKDKKTSL
jgi:radical SAM superfamily enzyme YgiQ (UPF0313 family)